MNVVVGERYEAAATSTPGPGVGFTKVRATAG